MAPGQHADFCYLRMLICHKLIGILLNTCVIPLAGTVFHITIREKLKRRDCPKKIYSTANGHWSIFVCKKVFVSDRQSVAKFHFNTKRNIPMLWYQLEHLCTAISWWSRWENIVSWPPCGWSGNQMDADTFQSSPTACIRHNHESG